MEILKFIAPPIIAGVVSGMVAVHYSLSTTAVLFAGANYLIGFGLALYYAGRGR